jgi:hypothetical protein
MVLGGNASTRIDHEHDDICLSHRLLGLARHFFVNAVLRVGLETAGIDDDEFELAEFGVAVMAVTRQTGKVSDDGVAGFG